MAMRLLLIMALQGMQSSRGSRLAASSHELLTSEDDPNRPFANWLSRITTSFDRHGQQKKPTVQHGVKCSDVVSEETKQTWKDFEFELVEEDGKGHGELNCGVDGVKHRISCNTEECNGPSGGSVEQVNGMHSWCFIPRDCGTRCSPLPQSPICKVTEAVLHDKLAVGAAKILDHDDSQEEEEHEVIKEKGDEQDEEDEFFESTATSSYNSSDDSDEEFPAEEFPSSDDSDDEEEEDDQDFPASPNHDNAHQNESSVQAASTGSWNSSEEDSDDEYESDDDDDDAWLSQPSSPLAASNATPVVVGPPRCTPHSYEAAEEFDYTVRLTVEVKNGQNQNLIEGAQVRQVHPVTKQEVRRFGCTTLGRLSISFPEKAILQVLHDDFILWQREYDYTKHCNGPSKASQCFPTNSDVECGFAGISEHNISADSLADSQHQCIAKGCCAAGHRCYPSKACVYPANINRKSR